MIRILWNLVQGQVFQALQPQRILPASVFLLMLLPLLSSLFFVDFVPLLATHRIYSAAPAHISDTANPAVQLVDQHLIFDSSVSTHSQKDRSVFTSTTSLAAEMPWRTAKSTTRAISTTILAMPGKTGVTHLTAVEFAGGKEIRSVFVKTIAANRTAAVQRLSPIDGS